MPSPVFDFTDRATPVVQFGRSVNRNLGNDHWGRGHWGTARWGMDDWEPVWADATCEIHEITTNTGRGAAPDRFVPGTAEIVASNVNALSTLIFPELPPPEKLEPILQPPISLEEDLQAPNAATVTSNGWSFTDDFETRPPKWVAPAAFLTTGAYPTRPMVWGDAYIEPETYRSVGDVYEAHGVAQWTGPTPYPLDSNMVLRFADLSFPTGTTGTPRTVVEIYAYGNKTDRSGNVVRFTLTPVFAGDNTAEIELFRWAADGTPTYTIGATDITSGLGTNGVFGPLEFEVSIGPSTSSARAAVNGHGTPFWGPDETFFATGSRIGFAVHHYEGNPPGDSIGGPHIVYFEGPDFVDDFQRPTGSGWVVHPKYAGNDALIVEDGALRPPVRYDDDFTATYEGAGSAQWVSEFEGDQYIEVEVTSMSNPAEHSAPFPYTYFELHLKGNRRDLRAIVVEVDYVIDWSPDPTSIDWWIYQAGPNGEDVYDPDSEGVSYGTIDYGVANGVFPDPGLWRVEADTTGEVRLYYNGTLLGAPTFPDPPDGNRIGSYLAWRAGSPITGLRPEVARFNYISGGLREPLGTEELGTWVRIGVHHQTLGNQWFFRGFVDGMTPTYVPDHEDAVRIECVDPLAEAGRAAIVDTGLNHQFAEAHTRIKQILALAGWPRKLARIGDDATVMSRPSSGKAVDALTHVAESCGGAVYGDPDTGEVVFWGQDWQAFAAGALPQAFITNHRPDDDEPRPKVCPSGWEMSQRRQDMNTRARFSTVTSITEEGEPIVREWRDAQAEDIYGIELAERTLLCVTGERLYELASRHLRLRSPRTFPRIDAVLLDAATADEALDLMATAQFHRPPSRYQCQLRREGEWVFNRQYLVTGIRHVMKPGQWTCRLQLDIASAFVAHGGRWGRSRWSQPDATWGRTR